MSETKHSPEPWRRGEEHETKVEIQQDAAPYTHIATAHASGIIGGRKVTDWRVMDANARRIVACVNACAGVSTEALESGALGALLDAVETEHAENSREIANEDHSMCGVCCVLRALGRLK